ncbi:hypothetical protein C4566_00235 [Candidatus Parcubacteria bacterium]|nr:MAG: hypothetical protein C4566_00235 [Candidatus Parcubacteria bacterium]
MKIFKKIKDFFRGLKTSDDWLLLVAKILLVGILFTPLLVSEAFYFPYIVPRNLLFRLLINILLGIYLWLWLNNSKYRFRSNKGLIVLFLFVLSLTVSSILGGDFTFSLWSNFERMDGLLGWYYIFVYIFVLLGLTREKKDWHLLFNFALIPAWTVALLAVAQRLNLPFVPDSQGGIRTTSTLGNAAYLGSYMFLNSVLAFYLLIIKALKKKFAWSWTYIWYALSVILFVSALVVSQTRGAFLGLFVWVLLLAIFYLWFNRKKRNKLYYALVAVVVLTFVFGALVYQQKDSSWVKDSYFLNKFASMSLDDTTVHSRWNIWKSTIVSVKEKPILGWGEESFRYVFNKYFPPEIYQQPGSEVWFDRPHNVLLQHLIQGGILGLALYLGVFAYLIFYLYKKAKKQKEWFFSFFWIAFLLGFLFQDLFIFDSLNINIVFYLILAYLFSLGTKKKWHFPTLIKGKEKKYVYLPLIIVLIGVVTFVIVYKPYKSNTLLIKSSSLVIEAQGRGDYTIALSLWRQSVAESVLGEREKAEVLSRMASGILSNPYVPEDIKADYFEEAEEYLTDTYHKNSQDVRLGLFLAYFYQKASGINPSYAIENVSLLTSLRNLAPERPDVLIQLNSAYLMVGDLQSAREVADDLKRIVPWAKLGYWATFNVDLYESNEEELRENLEKIKAINQYNYGFDFETNELDRLQLILTQAGANQDQEIADVIKSYLPQD